MSMLCDDARGAAFQTWARLIKCARIGAAARSQPVTVAAELLRTFLQSACPGMQTETDPDTLSALADGLSACLKNVGPGVLTGPEVMQLVQQLFALIDASLGRT